MRTQDCNSFTATYCLAKEDYSVDIERAGLIQGQQTVSLDVVLISTTAAFFLGKLRNRRCQFSFR